MSTENLQQNGASGNDTLRYNDKDDQQDVLGVLHRLESRLNHLEVFVKESQRSESSPHMFRRQAPYLQDQHLTLTDSRLSQSPYQATDNTSPNQATGNTSSPDQGVTAGNTGSSEIQERFNALKSSVEKFILPAGYKLHDSRTGVKREDQQTLNVVSKCGRYVETALKLILQSNEREPLDLEPIITTLLANINYLQDEYAALLVKGKFDDNTAQLFRSLQKSNSGFDSQSINNVRIAAELSSVSAKSNYRGNSRQVYRGNSYNYNSQQYGNNRYSGNYNRYSGYQNRRDDLFQNLQGPRFRNPGRGQYWQNRDQDQ